MKGISPEQCALANKRVTAFLWENNAGKLPCMLLACKLVDDVSCRRTAETKKSAYIDKKSQMRIYMHIHTHVHIYTIITFPYYHQGN